MSRLPAYRLPQDVESTPRNLQLAIGERERLKVAGLLVCAVPKCRTPRYRVMLHHVILLEIGGRDVPENMVPLCRDHHTIAHRFVRDRVRGALDREKLPGLLAAHDAREEAEAMKTEKWEEIRGSTPDRTSAEDERWVELAGGAKLSDLRRLRDQVQRDVARALGTSGVQVSRWERGEDDLRIETLRRYLDALGLDLDGIQVRDRAHEYRVLLVELPKPPRPSQRRKM